MKGTIWEEVEGIRDLTYDWGDYIIKIKNLTVIKLLTGTILKVKRNAINNYTRWQANWDVVSSYLWLTSSNTLLHLKNMGASLHCPCHWPQLLLPSPLLPEWTLHCLLLCFVSNYAKCGEGGSDWFGLGHMPTLAARNSGKVSGLFSLLPSYHDSAGGRVLKHRRVFQNHRQPMSSRVTISSSLVELLKNS